MQAFNDIRDIRTAGLSEELLTKATKEADKEEDKARKAVIEDRDNWAVYTFDLHQKMGDYLNDVKKNNPAKLFEKQNVKINTAYGINSHLCVKALENSGEGALQKLVNRSFDRLASLKKPNLMVNVNDPLLKKYEDALANLLYLAKLKYEFEHVNGSEDEQRKWKHEILTELMSDQFNENVDKYKNSEVFRQTLDYALRSADSNPESIIQHAMAELAKTKYHDIYYTFAEDVPNNPDMKNQVLKTVADLEEMKALCNTVGVKRTGDKFNEVDNNADPHFDTKFIMKRAKIYGESKNFMAELREEDEKNKKLNKFIQEETNKYILDYQAKNKYLLDEIQDEIKEREFLLEKIRPIDNKITELNTQFESLKTTDSKGFKKWNSKQEQIKRNKHPKMDENDQKFDKIHKEIAELEQIKQKEVDEFYPLFIKPKKLKNPDTDFNKINVNENKYNIGLSQVTKEAQNNIGKITEEFKRQYNERKKEEEASAQQTIKDEATKYKSANADERKKIIEARKKRDDNIKFEDQESYNQTVLAYDKKTGNPVANNPISNSASEAVLAVTNVYKDYKKQKGINRDLKDLDARFNESIRAYEEKEKLYDQKPPVNRPDRRNVKVDAFKIPVEDGINELLDDEFNTLNEIATYEDPNLENRNEHENEDQVKNEIPVKVKDEYANIEAVRKVGELLRQIPDNNDYLKDIKKAYEEENAEELFNAATKRGASNADKNKWAVYSLNLHQKLGSYLNYVNNDNREALNDDLNVNINNAYGINSHLCGTALSETNTAFMQRLVNKSYDEFASLKKPETYEFENEYHPQVVRYYDALARLLYFAKLKHEFKNVNGNAQEKSAWKGEILTELMSGNLESNIQKFKESDIFKSVASQAKNSVSNNPERIIQSAMEDLAKLKYHDIYYTFLDGAVKKEDKDNVLKTCAEIEEMKDICNAVGIYRTKDELNEVHIAVSPYFDTKSIMKRSKIYGERKNVMAELKEKEEKARQKKRYVEKCVADAEDLYKKNNSTLIESIDMDNKEKSCLSQVLFIDRTLGPLEKQLNKMEKAADPKNVILWKKAIQKKMNYQKQNVQKKDIEIENYNPSYASLREQIRNLTKNREALLVAQYGMLVPKDYSTSWVIEEDLEKIEKRLEENKKKYEDGLKAVVDEVRLNAPKEFEVNYKKEKEQEHFEIEMENNQYQFSLSGDKAKIRNKRAERDEKYYKNNLEVYKNCYVISKMTKGPSGTNYVSRNADEVKQSFDESYKIYKRQYPNRVSTDLEKTVQDGINKYLENEEKYDQKIQINKPDRSKQEIASYKAPIESGIKLDVVQAIDRVTIEDNFTAALDRINAIYDEREKYSSLRAAINEDYVLNKLQNANWFVHRTSSVTGTDEHENIAKTLDDFVRLKKYSFNYGDANKLREIRIMMDQYIQRKEDQKSRFETRFSTSYKRRTEMISARNELNNAIEALMQKESLKSSDCTLSDIAAEFDLLEKLTKSKPEISQKIREVISDRNQKVSHISALDSWVDKPETRNAIREAEVEYKEKLMSLLKDYLMANVDKYYRSNGTSRKEYSFRFPANEPEGKKNIPADTDERFYKTCLIRYEQLLNEKLEYIREKHPEKLPDIKYEFDHYNPLDPQTPSLNFRLGLKLPDLSYKTEMNWHPVDTMKEFEKQYSDNYKYLAAKMRYENLIGLDRLGKGYNVAIVLDDFDPEAEKGRENKVRVELALSALYAARRRQAMEDAMKDFSEYSVKEAYFKYDDEKDNLSKFLTLLKENGMLEKIEQRELEILKLPQEANLGKERLYNYAEGQYKLLSTPEMFGKVVVGSVLKDNITEAYYKIQKELAKEDGFSPKTVKDSFDLIESCLQIGSVLVLPQDKYQEAINNALKIVGGNASHGATFAATLANLKKAANEKMVAKTVEPAAKGMQGMQK